MADTLDITAGTGTTIATDDVGGSHYQRIKITDGTADGATHLKIVAEDAAHSSGDTGIVAMAVRQDAAASLAGADGDYVPLIVDASGQLWIKSTDLATLAGAVSGSEVQVDIVTSALPTGASTAALQTSSEALLTTIDADTGTLAVVGGGAEATALRVTVANDSTGVVSVDDGGGALTVDGTLTGITNDVNIADGGNSITVDNAGLTELEAAIDTEVQVDVVAALPAGTNAIGKLAANSGVDIGDVDVLSSALPTGAATAALQTSSEALLTTIDADTSTIAAAVDTEVQVDVVAALPAGTNAIGKLAANSGVDIGDVDVTSIAAGENVVGLVGASDTVVTVTCSLPTGALTAGDVMFDTQEIAAAARTSGGVVILESVTVLDKDDQAAEFDLVFLDAATSIGTEDSAVSIADADAEDILGVVNVATTDYTDLVGSQVATVKGIGLEMKADASTSLYVAGITRGTPTYTASGVLIKFAFIRS